MSELKATPGPWFITTEEGFFNICTLYCLPEDERTKGKGYANISSEGDIVDGEYTMADAHLIAAAPEMYGLLDQLASECQDDLSGRAVEAIKDLLKKARGEA